MFFIDCDRCDASIIGFGEGVKAWQRVGPEVGGGWLCPQCQRPDPKELAEGDPLSPEERRRRLRALFDLHLPYVYQDEVPSPAVTAKLLQEASRHAKVTVQVEPVGFDRPENGSGERYQERRKVRPWASHTFWWVVHNVIAHPLIGLLPFRPLFRFHDWTSERMHGC